MFSLALATLAATLAVRLLAQIHIAAELLVPPTILERVIYHEPNHFLRVLAQISDSEGSLARTYLSAAHRRAAKQIASWMSDAGMQSWVDVLGNVHGLINGTRPGEPALLLGSHYDTVLDAGKYDGTLGIAVGIAAVKAVLLHAAATEGVLSTTYTVAGDVTITNTQPGGRDTLFVQIWAGTDGKGLVAERLVGRPIHLVAFADEEGVRFGSTFLGSRALAGTLVGYNMLQATDRLTGETLEDVLRGAGVAHPEADIAALAVPAGQIAEYVEVHMEQGPVLHGVGQALGAVSAIAGQSRLRLTITGGQGHAGTVPMRGRMDALAAAAEVVGVIERRCGGGPLGPQGGDGAMAAGEDEMLVCTVGEFMVWPGASNVIAGSATLSIDIRSKGDDLRRRVVENITASIADICQARGVQCKLVRSHDAAAVLCDPLVVNELVQAIRRSQALLHHLESNKASGMGSAQDDELSSLVPAQNGPGGTCSSGAAAAAATGVGDAEEVANTTVPVLVSGAGHDAMAIAEVAKIGMMFVRCGNGGISHSPLESVLPSDVAAATAALALYLQQRVLHGAA